MNEALDIRRGEEAHRILSAEIYREAFSIIEERLISQLATIEITQERAEYLRQLLVANRKVRSYMEQVMLTGRMAEEQKSLMERVRDKARSIL